MNAADLAAEIENRFHCVQGPYRPKCQTGEPYVVLGFEDWSRGGNVSDPGSLGQGYPGCLRPFAPRRHYATEEEACEDMLKAFNLYAAWCELDGLNGRGLMAHLPQGPNGRPTLYWRYDAPHVFWYPDESHKGRGADRKSFGALKVRLVLSCLPVVEEADADYDAARTAELEHDILKGAIHGQ